LACHRVVNLHAEMCSKVIPHENFVEVGAWDIVCLNIIANIIMKITENVGGGANGTQTSDPMSRVLNTPTSAWRKSWIPLLECKDKSGFCTVVVMSAFSDTISLHGPPLFFQSHPKLINVNELPSGILKNTKSKMAVPKAPDAELHIRPLGLAGFSRCLLLSDVKL
jgi:hypothetical protein